MIRNRKVLVGAGAAAVVLVVVLAAVLLWPSRTPVDEPDGRVLVVGSSDFPEASLVGEMYAQSLENGGYAVDRNLAIGSREQYMLSFSDGELDVVPEYVGALSTYLSQQAGLLAVDEPEATSDLDETLVQTRDFLTKDAYNAVLTTPSAASPGPALAVAAAYAAEHKLAAVSDLTAVQDTLKLGGPEDCASMDACAKGLADVYDIEPAEVVPLDFGGPKTTEALAAGTVDAALVWSTDPEVASKKLVVLKDDKGMQVADNMTAMMPHEVATPDIVNRLDNVNAALTTAELAKLNGQVASGVPFTLVARNFLVGKGLVPPPPTPSPVPTPTPTAAAGGKSGGSSGGGSSGGAGWTAPRNRGNPSSKAQSQNWAALADCESGGNPAIVSSNGLYHGLYQFSKSTWQAQGGASVASNAPADEQTYRAQVLYDAAGSSPWPHCGKYL